MEILNLGFDHVEFVVNDFAKMESVFTRLGFEKTGERTHSAEGTRSIAFGQGNVRIMLTAPDRTGTLKSTQPSHALDFLKNHAEGICVLAIDVSDATAAFRETVKLGARPAMEPKTIETPEGSFTRAEVWTPGDVRYAFITRKSKNGKVDSGLLDEGLHVSRLKSPSPLGIQSIDHLTNNVGIGEMKTWVDFYQNIFKFKITRHFDIRTGRTGLTSDVIESPGRQIKVPINEATEPESQVQEFVNRMKGAGVQHLALLTDSIQDTLKTLRQRDLKFLSVPHTYYEAVPTRVPGVTEDLAELEKLGILLDGEGGGYLLQIFSQEILGPFFFEFIQRKGNEGFGEGNFRALFEAIERDQVVRGVL